MVCGKVIFKNRTEAAKQVAGMTADKKPSRSRKQPNLVYYCRDCGGYHLATPNKRKQPRLKIQEEVNSTERITRENKSKDSSLHIRDFTFKQQHHA